MKAVKLIGKIVLWTIALIVVLLLALPLWIGPVAKSVANSVTPGITGTGFNLGEFALNPYTGVLKVGAMELDNPTNCSEKTAVKLDSLSVDVGMTSLAGDLIKVEDVTLDGLYVYLSGVTGGNFQTIAETASGGNASATKPEPVEETPPAAEPEKGGKKVVIDHLVLKNIKLKIGIAPAIPVPVIELKDVGKPKDETAEAGITLTELWKMLANTVMSAAGSVADGVKALGEGAGAALGTLGEGAGAAAGAATGVVTDGAKAIGDGAGKAADAVGKGVNKAADTIKGLFK